MPNMMNIPVLLQNIRIRGLGDVVDTSWLDIGRNLTIFSLPQHFNRKGFLQALQTIHPPFSCHKRDPFREYPRITRQGKYQKRVRPHRRTIAFAIFVAQPGLVKDLGEISPNLYEADRIEVGRRLDCSRWVNFVEIAGSTRWSEVYRTVGEIAGLYPQSFTPFLKERVSSLQKTDRIVDETRELLTGWLFRLLEAEKGREKKELLEQTLFLLQRQVHFIEARKTVKQYLPVFHIIDDCMPDSHDGSSGNSPNAILHLADGMHRIRLREKAKKNVVPLLLFDEPGLSLDDRGKESLRELVRSISREIQCLYMVSEKEDWRPEEAAIITAADMFR